MNIIRFSDSNTYGYARGAYFSGCYDADSQWGDIGNSSKARPVIDAGRAVPFSRNLENRDFESKENKDAFSALLPQTSRRPLAVLPGGYPHKHFGTAVGPGGDPA